MDHQKQTKLIEEFYHIMDQWLTLYEEKRSVADILAEKGYSSVAIFGMGTMAAHLWDALKGSKVEIKYIIDWDTAVYGNGITTKSLEEQFDSVDVVIYTNPNENEEILKRMGEKLQCKVISLSDVIFDSL